MVFIHLSKKSTPKKSVAHNTVEKAKKRSENLWDSFFFNFMMMMKKKKTHFVGCVITNTPQRMNGSHVKISQCRHTLAV